MVKLLPLLDMLDIEFCLLDKDVDVVTKEAEEGGAKEAVEEVTSTQE